MDGLCPTVKDRKDRRFVLKTGKTGSGKTQKRQIVTLGVPFYPTAQAAVKLLHCIQISGEVRAAVAGFLAQRAERRPERLLDVALRQSPSRARGQTRVQHMNQEQLLTQLREARDVLGWDRVLPASTINLIGLDALAASLQPSGIRRQDVLPSLALDGGLWALDPFRVSIHALGDDAVQWADTFALPSAYCAALRRRQEQHLQGERKRLLQAQERFQTGEQDALADGIRIGGRVQPGDLEGVLPEMLCAGEDAQPRALERTVIRQVRRPEGKLGWEIGLKFSSPVLPTGSLIPDTVGVDIGADLLMAWASGIEEGELPQTLLRLPVPTAPAPSIGLAPRPFEPHLGQAWGRRLILEALRAGYEAALMQILRYEQIAVEDIDWTTFKHGFRFAEFAKHAHLHTVLGWLEALAPLHDSRIVRVDPHYTSRTCSRCGWVNRRRPRRGELFRCGRPGCGHVQVSHLNSALVIRSRADHPTRTGR